MSLLDAKRVFLLECSRCECSWQALVCITFVLRDSGVELDSATSSEGHRSMRKKWKLLTQHDRN